MSRDEKADANLDANTYGISHETEDNGDPDNDPWTRAQLETLAALALQDIATFGIPKRLSPSCSDPAGIGFHTIFGAPSCWTPSVKSCPGTVRKRQFYDTLWPMILEGATDMEADLSASAKTWLDQKMREMVRWLDHGDPTTAFQQHTLQKVRAELAAVRATVGELTDDEANILAAISVVDAGMSPDEVLDAAAAIAAELKQSLPPALIAALAAELTN
jgi:hypothetical protein